MVATKRPRPGQPTKYAPERCADLIDKMGQGDSVSKVCADWGIARETFYEWTRVHEQFSDSYKKAGQALRAWYEAQFKIHAAGGVKGGNVAALIFLSKNVAGFRETQDVKVETSGSVEVRHEVKLAGISDAFMSKVQAMMLKEAAKGDKPKKGD